MMNQQGTGLPDLFLYPVCYAKLRTRALLAPFCNKVQVLAASSGLPVTLQEEESLKKDGQGDGWGSLFHHLAGVQPFVPEIFTPEQEEEFQKTFKGLRSWGDQMRIEKDFDIYYQREMTAGTSAEEIQELASRIKGGREQDTLFDARLFLTLSQEADMQQDQVDMELFHVDMEAGRLRELVDGDENMAGYLAAGLLPQMMTPLPRARERLRAWAILACASGIAFEADGAVCLPLGESIAVKDLMDMAYESMSGKSGLDIIELPLSIKQRDLEAIPEDVREMFTRVLDKMGKAGAMDANSATALLDDEDIRALREWAGARIRSGAADARLVVTIYPDQGFRNVLIHAAGLERLQSGEIAGCKEIPELPGSLFLI